MRRVRAVLFDLDGTLADTAADLTRALNHVLVGIDVEPVPLSRARTHVSQGAVALLALGLGAGTDDPRVGNLRGPFLEFYANNLCVDSCLFDGIDALLRMLDDGGIAWGVVTNKPRAYTLPLLDALPLPTPPGVVVCGDDLAVKKPHPLPVRHACATLDVSPTDTLFVGDDPRDITAGLRAGTGTVVAGWGYIDATVNPGLWGADGIAAEPAQLGAFLRQH
jgi:N-acetyl-D-muramate 6-phosphate phosphatase